jgi:hypothetical protein
MAKCQIKNCDNDVSINKNTKQPHTVCRYHYERIMSENAGPKQVTKVRTTAKKTEEKRSVETFILRGNLLTVNVENNISNIKVDKYTRAYIYNDDDVVARSGAADAGRYVLGIKQNGEMVKGIIYKSKKKREIDFIKLQELLSKVY